MLFLAAKLPDPEYQRRQDEQRAGGQHPGGLVGPVLGGAGAAVRAERAGGEGIVANRAAPLVGGPGHFIP